MYIKVTAIKEFISGEKMRYKVEQNEMYETYSIQLMWFGREISSLVGCKNCCFL
jgi:hypothetical protein